MRLSVSEQALDDARDTAHWYISEGAWPVALCLQEQVEEALIAITRTPGLGTPGPANTKLFPVRRFPVSLVYRVDGDMVRAVAVAGQRRRPGLWLARH